MCNPALAVVAFTAVTSAYQINEQEKQAEYQYQVQKANAEANNQAVLDNYMLQNKAMNDQQAQADDKANADKRAAMLEAQKAAATQRVGSGEAGLSGLSIDFLMADIERQGLNNMTNIDVSHRSDTSQRQYEQEIMRRNSNASFVNVSAPLKGSSLSKGLAIGSSALNSYMAAGGTFGGGGGATSIGDYSLASAPNASGGLTGSGGTGLGLKSGGGTGLRIR